jgi:hypothetical protein
MQDGEFEIIYYKHIYMKIEHFQVFSQGSYSLLY